jgi:glutamate---cysteine ligase / carboxylate-amine ligase
VDLMESHAVVSARKLLHRLVQHVRPALEDVGDYDTVSAELARLDYEGNGAMRQRRAWRRRQDVQDVIAELATATLS